MHIYTFIPAHRWMRRCSVAGIRRPAAATPRQHYVGDSPLSASTQHDIINTRQLTTPRARTAYMVPYPPTKVPFPMGDVNPPSNTWFTEPTGVCPQNQGQSSTSCSAFRRRQQTQPRNKRRAPEWWIVYICEQVCITYDGWNMKVLVFWLCNGFTV